jgi:hypothetical protein
VIFNRHQRPPAGGLVGLKKTIFKTRRHARIRLKKVKEKAKKGIDKGEEL